MITLCKPEKPFEYTAKGNARRHPSISMYNDEIEAVYKAVEESSLVDISTPASWEPTESIEFIRSIVARVMKTTCRTMRICSSMGVTGARFHSPSFQVGRKLTCNNRSLQATWIRNSILHAFRETSAPVHEVQPMFVFSNPSIRALAETVTAIGKTKMKNQRANRWIAAQRME